MGLVLWWVGRYCVKRVHSYADSFTNSLSPESQGRNYDPRRYEAYLLIADKVKRIANSRPNALAKHARDYALNPDITDVAVYPLFLLYHDVIYSEIRSGKYHISHGELDPNSLAPHLLDAMRHIVDFVIKIDCFPGKTKDDLTKAINVAIASTSPYPQSNNNDENLMAIDSIHRRY